MSPIVSNITLKNFKFFHQETVDITKNVLFYGENGSGKSSLYWALKIYFEHLTKIISDDEKDEFFNLENPKNLLNRNYLIQEEQELSVTVTPNIDISKDTIHFINHKTLSDIFSSELDQSVNFFNILNHEWFKKYTLFDRFQEKKLALGMSLDNTEKMEFDTNLKIIIKQLEEYTNKIIQEKFEEKLIEIKFKYLDTEIALDALFENSQVVALPKIEILVNQIPNPQHHFNEAKLKLISLAIHFAIIKLSKPTNDYNGLRLAVFDDFLQSLDMSYRDVVLDYIFSNFTNYQIIMMTHDLQFYKLLKRKTEFYSTVDSWEYKNIYVSEISKEGISIIFPMIYDNKNNDTYLEQAEEALILNDFDKCGNSCRKELEKTIINCTLDLELTNKGQLKSFFNLFNDKENNNFSHYYLKPQYVIKTLLNGRTEPDTFEKIDLRLLQKHLRESEFYNNIVLNPSSHDDIMERFQREFKSVIENIKGLKKLTIKK